MSLRASLIALGVVCSMASVHAQEFSAQPLPSSRRQAFIRGHADCVDTYVQRFETSSAPPGDVADAALESCSSWMDDLKRAVPSFEDRDTTVAKIESRARRIAIKQVLEARLAAGQK
jgi:hypothetical protein